MRGVRAVLASLPDVPGERGGNAVAARPHRCDEGGRRRCPDGPRLRGDHSNLRSVPGLRDRVPVLGALRSDDGGDPRGHRGPLGTLVAAFGLLDARASPVAAVVVSGRGSRAALGPGPSTVGGAVVAAAASGSAAAVGVDRLGRVAVHRLCHGRVATVGAPGRHLGDQRVRVRGGSSGSRGFLLWRAARSRGTSRWSRSLSQAGDGLVSR